MEIGQLAVGEHELGLFVAVQVDNALGIVDHIARTIQFRYYHRAHREFGEVDGPILQSGVFHWTKAAVHRLKAEAGIGDGLGEVRAVHLDEMDSGQTVIEENQLFDAVSGLQLHLLGRGIQHMAVPAGVPFLCPVSAGFAVGEQDLPKFIGLEDAQALGVPEDLKGDVGHCPLGAALILDDPQTRQLLVDDGGVTGLACHHRDGLDSVGIRDPAGDASHLTDFPAAGLQVVEHGHTADLCLGSLDLAAFNVLDLHGDAVERVSGVTQLLDPQRAVGRVPKGQGGNLVVLHIGVLGALLRQKVILGRDLLSDGVMALQGQGDDDYPIRAGGEGAHLAALRVIDGKHSAL